MPGGFLSVRRYAVVLWIGLACVLGGCGSNSEPTAPDTVDTPTPVPAERVVALYSGVGAWEFGLTRIEERLREWGYESQRVSDSGMLAGELRDGRYSVLIMPGGDAGKAIDALGSEGIDEIRRFVESGGGYVGICAGAYLASDRITWYGVDLDYPLDLFSGVAIGPLEELAVPGHFGWTDVRFDGTHPAAGGVTGVVTAYYFDGPRFEGAASVFAWYDRLDAPAALSGSVGTGRYVLSGFHPEMSVVTAPALRGMIDWVSGDGNGAADHRGRMDAFLGRTRRGVMERLEHAEQSGLSVRH